MRASRSLIATTAGVIGLAVATAVVVPGPAAPDPPVDERQAATAEDASTEQEVSTGGSDAAVGEPTHLARLGERPSGDRGSARVAGRANCRRWVAPSGDDRNRGSRSEPWATLEHAVETVPDRGCTVWFESGVYTGIHEVERRFDERTVLRAAEPYGAVLENDGTILDIGDAARRMTFRGFRFRQTRGASGVAVYVSGGDGPKPAPNHLTFVDNIFHDAYDEDLLKIRSQAHSITVRGNVFYNQGANEQHIDVNSVTNVVIEGNIFFNSFGASGRNVDGTTKHFIVVKDSNEGADGLEGSDRIAIRRNVFLNWQGGDESFIGIGNDGKSYHEATRVWIENNLLIGNGRDEVNTPLTVYGARDVAFVNNTVVGNLPSDAYAFEVHIKGRNPQNQHLSFFNNIWSDHTATMGSFSDGDRAHTTDLALDNNLYWNDGRKIPAGDLVSPLRHDARRVVGDPRLSTDHAVTLPVWDGTAFRSGEGSIRAEFGRLVRLYGRIPAGSPAVGRALRSLAPRDDILGRSRDRHPDLGAFEARGS